MRGSATVVIALAACAGPRGNRVQLAAPPPEAPFPQRLATFQALRSAGAHVDGDAVSYLALADRRLVYEPEDLLPVVAPDSPTARAVDDYRKTRRAYRVRWGVTGAFAAASGATFLTAGALDQAGYKDPAIGVAIGGAAFAFGAVVAYLFLDETGWSYPNHPAVATAFTHYNASLAHRLRICVDGITLVDCNAR